MGENAIRKTEAWYEPFMVFGEKIMFYARTRGWPYVMAWGHRVSGVLLVLFVWFHIITLSSLMTPGEYDAKMRFVSGFFFVLLEWLLAFPVVFHALNGGRLILYESFGLRRDTLMIRWVLALTVVYAALLGVIMILGDQGVTPVLFWAGVLVPAVCLVVVLAVRLKSSPASLFWKLHRLAGVFLLAMIPAHMFFMHIAPSTGHESMVILERLRIGFIKIVDLAMVISLLYHAGYGLVSIFKDYYESRIRGYLVAAAVVLVMTVFLGLGVRIIVTI